MIKKKKKQALIARRHAIKDEAADVESDEDWDN